MNFVSIANIVQGLFKSERDVTVCGWVRTRRDSKSGISFLSVYDGSCFDTIQVIIRNTLSNYKKDVLCLTTGCSVIVTGKIVISSGKDQNFEMHASSIQVTGWIENPDTYPISSKYHSVEYLREMAHLRPRTNLIGAVTRVRHTLSKVLHRFFDEEGYLWVATPLITSHNTEGLGEMFRVSTLDIENAPKTKAGKVDYTKDFFGKETFLTVSGQLNNETYACALSKIYSFGPIFRAENSNTSRHLSEFWMLEPEVAFANLDDISSLAEKMLKEIFRSVLKECTHDMKFFTDRVNIDMMSRLEQLISSEFAHLNYTDAIMILKKYEKKFQNKVEWGIDFTSEQERYLVEEYFKSPIIIKNYPKSIKAFYMRLNDDEKTVASMDVLMPGVGEIIGGSQREERLEILDARMVEMNINKKDYWWYRDLRRYGTVPHSGFGLGFERLVAYVTGVHNIRDVIAFPRSPRNANF